MKNWPFVFGGLASLVLLIVGGFFWFSGGNLSRKPATEPVQEQVPPPEISLRPFFSFAPRDDGKAIQISISGILPDTKIDYEITYKTGAGIEQGIGGPVALESGQSFYSREHIFGTCSKNVCSYDSGVEYGKWKATIEKGLEIYELVGSWRLQNLGGKVGKLGFNNEFELDIESGTFSKSFFVITTQNSSLPKNLPKEAKFITGPFTLLPAKEINFKKSGQVAFFGESLSQNAKILQISSTTPSWTPLETKIDPAKNFATATTSAFGTFVLVEKI